MNRIGISVRNTPLPQWSKTLKIFALKVLAHLGRDKWKLSILLCDDGTISELNFRYRGEDEPTDVLSFNMGEWDTPHGVLPREHFKVGDIVISLDTLKENARRFNVKEDEELRRLLIHGILHLDGMDHETNNKDEPMLLLQEEILAEFAEERIMEENL